MSEWVGLHSISRHLLCMWRSSCSLYICVTEHILLPDYSSVMNNVHTYSNLLIYKCRNPLFICADNVSKKKDLSEMERTGAGTFDIRLLEHLSPRLISRYGKHNSKRDGSGIWPIVVYVSVNRQSWSKIPLDPERSGPGRRKAWTS